ncbi:MAG: ABC transporter permease [Actinomycetaceae bacterium]|nr:ABC transporter permease [Actinomycetaceae bacterium]
MLRLIIKREISTILGSKAMRISSAIIVVLLLAGGAIAGYFLDRENVTIGTPPEPTGNTVATNPVGYLLSMIAILIVFTPTVIGMSALNMSVVEEKSSRIVEILLSTVKPRTLLLGKVLGVGAAMLAVITTYILALFGGLYLAGVMPTMGSLGRMGVWGLLPMTFVWMAVFFLTITSIGGAISATVSRQEDLSGVQTPLIFMCLAPLYVAMYLVPHAPDLAVTRILSHVPVFSPLMMPVRMSMGGLQAWEQPLALALSAVAIVLLAALSGRIYERSVLHTGSRVKFSQIFGKRA